MDYLNILLITTVTLLWGSAVWLWQYRNRPNELSKLFPLMQKYRKNRLHPLFRNREDVLWLAGWFFGIGLLILVPLMKKLFSIKA